MSPKNTSSSSCIRRVLSPAVCMLFVVLARLCPASSAQPVERVVVVDSGRPRAAILLSAKPTKAAQLGAFELQEHIRLITGIELPIHKEGGVDVKASGEMMLSIGDTELARTHGLQGEAFKLRERLVRVVPEAVFLIGRDALDFGEVSYRRVPPGVAEGSPGLYDVATWPSHWAECGSLLAVYDFLEQHGGVRWLTPGDDGTYYQSRNTLAVFSGEKRRESSFRFSRGPHDFLGTTTPWHPNTEGHARYIEAAFGDAHRVSDREVVRRAYRVAAGRAFLHRKRYGGEWFNANHSFASFYSRFWEPSPRVPETFVEKRSELFGKGYPGRPPQLCLSDPATLAQFVQDGRDFFDYADTPMLRDYRKRYPELSNYFAVVPEDNVGWCRCEACRAQLAVQPADSRVNGNASDHVWGFVNAVARELKQSHPDQWVSSLAYWHYSFPPKNVRLEDNIAVQLCMQIRMPYARERQKTDWEMAAAWGREYPNMPKYVWAYYCFPEERSNRGPRDPEWKPSWHCFPGFFSRTIASEFRKYRDINVRGIYFNGFGYDVENYVTFALLEDVDADVEKILLDFFAFMYGPAAEPLRQFYTLVEEIYSNPANYPGDDVVQQTEYLAWGFLGTPARMEALSHLVAEADRLVATGTPAQQHRVARFKINLWDYMREGRRLYEETNKTEGKWEPRAVACPFLLDDTAGGDPLRVNWADAQVLDLWRPVTGQGTTRRVLGDIARDRTHLYVRLCDLPPARELVHGATPGDGDFWKIFWADPEERTAWQLTLGPDGAFRTTMRVLNAEPVPYEAGARVHSTIAQDGTWTAWVSLPLDALPAQRNAVWMQFARGLGAGEDLAMFAPMDSSLTDVERFAVVRLDDAGSVSAAAVEPSDDGVVLQWRFEEEDGTRVADASGLGNDGRLVGSVLREQGPFGRCLRMRGLRSTANHVELDALRGLPPDSAFTVSFWVNLDLAIWKLENSSVQHTLVEIPEKLFIRIGASSTPSVVASLEDGGQRDLKVSSRPLTPLEWEHVAVTYDGNRLALYLNGRLAAQSVGVVFAKTASATPPLVLGRHTSGAFHRQFRGQLDEVRLDARAWSAGEVLARYRKGLQALAAFSVAKDSPKLLPKPKHEGQP